MSIAERARLFATAAHAAVGQRRKYTNQPYIVHPAQVASTVELAGGDENMIAAAWLHDVVEDTQVSVQQIRAEFGMDIAMLVSELTDVAVAEDGNRAARTAINRAHTSMASARAKTIKLADLLDNTSDIVENDPKFAKLYLAEKIESLKVLVEGDESLHHACARQLWRALRHRVA